jgi:NAD(P)H-hydrate epimerase
MRALDAAAIAAGASEDALLEAAGAGAASLIIERFGTALRVICVCGAGNNGGDGFVVARRLRESGLAVACLLVASREPAGAAGRALERAAAAGVPISRVGAVGEGLRDAGLVVDALLGTGASDAPRGAVAEAIAAIGRCDAPVVALDVPSGVDASTGETPGAAVTAALTLTFQALKLGLVVMPGLRHAGPVEVVPIGLPDPTDVPARLCGLEVLRALPVRDRFGGKRDAGAVLVVGGSRGLTGAVALAARSAQRAGAGLVTAAVPASLEPILEAKLSEPMTWGAPDVDGALGPAGVEPIVALAARCGAVVLGPGAGRAPGTGELLRAVALAAAVPAVIDADGLHAFAGTLEAIAGRSAATILTPHAGEAASLLGVTVETVARRRLHAAVEIARRAGAHCLLKGPDMIVAGPEGSIDVRDGDDPGLATAGAGDVLAGVIGALLARGMAPPAAAIAGAVAHLAAARAAAGTSPGRATIASDVIDHLRLGPGAGTSP